MVKLEQSRVDGLDFWAICTDTGDVRKIRKYLGDLGALSLPCYIGIYGSAVASNESPDAAFRLFGMPITYLVGRSSRIEGYITGAADWLSPSGARLLQFYREQG